MFIQLIYRQICWLYYYLGIAAFFLMANVCYSSWNPDYLISASLIEGNNQNILKNTEFQDLKKQVLKYLENSWCSQEKTNLIMDFLVLEQPKICVEIGVFSGDSLLPIAAIIKYLNQGIVYAIDPWSNAESIRNMIDQDPNKQWWSEVDMNYVYKCYQDRIQTWALAPYITTLRQASERAVHHIGQIDFIHMDGNYTRESALNDALLYLPKLKKGGCILFSNLF